MSKRKLVWARTGSTAAALPAGASAQVIDVLENFRANMGILLGLPGVTIMRVRVDAFAANLTAGGFPFWLGLKTMDRTTFTELLGDATARLNASPQRDLHSDWMMWKACYPNHGSDATTGVPNATTVEIDVRSMRKMDELGETCTAFMSKEVSTAGYTVHWSSSVLLALP